MLDGLLFQLSGLAVWQAEELLQYWLRKVKDSLHHW
jgi:hypothetical protein